MRHCLFDGVSVFPCVAFSLLGALMPLHSIAQSQTGELRVHVVDSQGLALPARISLTNAAADVAETLETNSMGDLTITHLPYGRYLLDAEHPGFVTQRKVVDVESALPRNLQFAMRPGGQIQSVRVTAVPALLATSQAGIVNRIGRQQIEERPASLPGRGLIDLVNSQPGWLLEGNAVLHPRGSEYQTQFVVDGIPLTENRSPGFGAQLPAASVDSMAIYTAGIPAEFGRKMGGIVEVNTLRDIPRGLHGTVELSGGSFATYDGFAGLSCAWGKNSAGLSGSGAATAWYENPPVLQDYTNEATTGDAAGNYERQFSSSDRFTATARHEFARFLVPNEQVQQSAGQRQDRSAVETMGTAAWQHILSTNSLADASGMVRDDLVLLSSNPQSTPIIASQNRGFREAYLQASLTQDWRRQEIRGGVQGDFLNLHEAFDDSITDPSQFDPGTPQAFSFYGRGRDREQALYVEDTARFGAWTIAPGIRWDNYSLLVHRNAFSPRLAAARYLPRAALVAHFAYDRVFQTPAFENILLSSSPQVISLDPRVLRKPVLPSNGNYYEAGLTKDLHNALRVNTSVYLRRFRNYADDNPLLDTSISFPIAFDRASIFGAEGKLDLPHWGILSGYASYSWMLGTCYLPVTGGLFLGDQATQALDQLSGRLWVSQDQRNTLRTRWIVHLPAQSWIASGVEYGSGLPVDFDGTRAEALAQYGAALVSRVNFARGRIDPSLALNASAAKEWALRDSVKLRLRLDGENLNNRVNILDFAGLFSGNAVSPPRSGSASLHVDF